VGEASIAGSIVAAIGTGVAAGAPAGDELQAARITPNPIVMLNPRILKVCICFMCLIVSLFVLSGGVPQICGLVATLPLLSVYQRALLLAPFWPNSQAFLRFFSGCTWQSFMARRYASG
jgi:energy-coupling factor transporter transmembrane protein EcfT